MKYKQQYIKLQKQLADEKEQKERYESYWHTEKDTNTSQKEKILRLEERVRDLDTSKLKLEVDLLKKIVSLHERQPTAPDVHYVGSIPNTPNVTSSSTTFTI